MSIDTDLLPSEGATLKRAIRSARAERTPELRQRDRAPIRAAEKAASYQARLLTSEADLAALEQDWNRLTLNATGPHAFQSFDLCMAWLNTYVFCDQPSHAAHVIALYDQDQLVGLLPLAVRTSGAVRLTEWIGEPLVQYGDVLVDAEADTKALTTSLADALETWPVSGLLLRNVRNDAIIHQLLDLKQTALGEPRQAAIAMLDGFGSADDYFATFTKRSRQNRRKKRNALAKLGELSFEVVQAGPEAAILCDLALRWKQVWLAERGLSSRAFMDDRAMTALRAAIARPSAANPLTLSVLKIDGEPTAIEVSLNSAYGVIAFIGTYDPAYELRSPGKVQMESTVLHAFDVGLPRYDMLAPMMGYKESWATTSVDVCDYLIAHTWQTRLYRDLFLNTARPALKAAWNAMPTRLRGALVRANGAA